MFTPAQYCTLPGTPFPAPGDTYPDKDQVAEYLADYGVRHDLPIRLLSGMTVRVRSVDVTVLHPTSSAQLGFTTLHPAVTDFPGTVLEGLRADDDAVLDQALGSSASPRLRALYSGVVLGSLVHDISLLRHLFGGIVEVDAVDVWPEQDDLVGDPPSLSVTGRLPLPRSTRTRLAWHFLPEYPSYREIVTIHHDLGTFELAFGTPYLLNAPTELRVVDAEGSAERRSVHRSVTEAFEQELLAFHAMVTQGTPPRSGIAEGRDDIRTSQRIMQSSLAEQLHEQLDGEAAHL